jgi:hypothetical protein
LASGIWSVKTLLIGNTTSELGAIPKLHCIMAPMQTCCGMAATPFPDSIECTPEIQVSRRRFERLLSEWRQRFASGI